MTMRRSIELSHRARHGGRVLMSTQSDSADRVREHLGIALSAAVPLHIAEIRQQNEHWLMAEASRCAEIIGSHGDALQYGGKHSAECFNALARGLACAALIAEGGVTWGGQHWCSDSSCHHEVSDVHRHV